MIIYNCKILKKITKGATGLALFPFIFIFYDKDHELTDRLVAHEKVHIKQQLKYFLIGYLFLYFFNDKKRYDFEFEAYIESIRHGMPIEWAATYLSSSIYKNMVTHTQAKQDIEEYLNEKK